jgi:enediyne polyketide synthase
MKGGIAIVGMACRYPDARSPNELWENVLARRRAFRRMPLERLSLRDYLATDPAAPDSIYSTEAALIQGYEFDRMRFRVSGPIFRSVDMVHWLALDVADQAIRDAGMDQPGALPQETTGVLLGNTLTGEFSRAATLRLRWPYVRRLVDAHLRDEQWDEQHRIRFLGELEREYKAPFAPVTEETLAGALSNTIAGRICNYFHLGGGGYTLDGACCSSLLAVARACSALESGELDAALAGGVDLSLDPFELVGFAKAGALARNGMLVYDRHSTGFLPGEGAGFVVLMRREDAVREQRQIYAVIQGWGISSDGGGSITRPEMHGQMLALKRAYSHAGYGPETVAFFEGHGTGTPIGDEVELQTLTAARKAAGNKTPPAAVGSIKANIGHTKAAAGIAGLIKATMAVHRQVLPPTTGVCRPRPELEGDEAVLRVLEEAEPWPDALPLRAGVNSFGFGGINVHVTLHSDVERRTSFSPSEETLLASDQDCELFVLDASSRFDLAVKAGELAKRSSSLSFSELGDVSAALAKRLGAGRWRAAVVASTPSEFAERLESVVRLLGQGTTRHFDDENGVFLSAAGEKPRIAFLFPGQASPVRLGAGAFGKRFRELRELYKQAALPEDVDSASTLTAQPAIIAAELAGLRALRRLGIEASLGLGHSLGELAAYCWAGALDEESLLALAQTRGRLMAEVSGPAGTMASIAAPVETIQGLIAGDSVVLACFNGPEQNVISGETNAVLRVVRRAQNSGWSGTVLMAGHAFHSPLMASATVAFEEAVNSLSLKSIQRRVISTISGVELKRDSNLRRLLVDQLTAPVKFTEALASCMEDFELFLEVGPGRVLTNLIKSPNAAPVIPLDACGPSIRGLLQAAAAAYVLGAPVRLEALFEGRFNRPFDFDQPLTFFTNPCELAPAASIAEMSMEEVSRINDSQKNNVEQSEVQELNIAPDAISAVRALIAQRTELPESAIGEGARLLRDLHLNSIIVAEIVAAAARRVGAMPPARPLQFADATVGELARALEQLRASSSEVLPEHEAAPAGVANWCRAFSMEWRPDDLPPASASSPANGLWNIVASPNTLLPEQGIPSFPGSGVIVYLDDRPIEDQATLLLEGAHTVLRAEGPRYFVMVGPEASVASAFARTLHLENSNVSTRVIEAPLNMNIGLLIARELSSAQEHAEARYDCDGRRWQRNFTLLANHSQERVGLNEHDVILVSGGGKGIVARCISGLAKETGAKLLILGRSNPQEDVELATQLSGLTTAGVKVKYVSADISDSDAVIAAVREAEPLLGRVTCIVHGAGRNEPMLLRDLDEAAMRRTLAPKVQGLRNLLAAVDLGQLRLLFSFGSVIGRLGMRGEAHYALANSCLVSITESFSRQYPACHCVVFESSAWSGAGMAERLDVLDSLQREGISAITLEDGIHWFRELLAPGLPSVAIVVTGRLGAFSPLPTVAPPLPLLRYLERPRVYYAGVELVVDSDLSSGSDTYLLDHVFHGEPLFPGVMGLEAMAQAAMAVTGAARLPAFEDVHFEQPLAIKTGTRVTLRAAALVRDDGSVEVVLRSSLTSFAMDHFRCICRFEDGPDKAADAIAMSASRIALDPERDLYGSLLFQNGRFRRLSGYRSLSAGHSCAEITPAGNQAWFSAYLPATLMLGDAGARDAGLHSIQACVPHAVLLPVGIDRMLPRYLEASEPLLACSRERWQQGNTYCYDLEFRDLAGVLRESWIGLRLHKVADAPRHAWPDALIAASLEWRVREMGVNTELAAVFERDHSTDRKCRSERAIQKALKLPLPVERRADGKPEVQAAVSVSAAHMNGLTLAVAGHGRLACDLEAISARTDEVWRDLLGWERWRLAELIAKQTGEDLHTAATRVWTAIECLKKAGVPEDSHLVFHACFLQEPSCVSLAMDNLKIMTAVVRFHDDPMPAAVSILTGS